MNATFHHVDCNRPGWGVMGPAGVHVPQCSGRGGIGHV